MKSSMPQFSSAQRRLRPAICATAALALLLPTAASVNASPVAGAAATQHIPKGPVAGVSSVNQVIEWNRTATDAAVAACIAPTMNPLHESRMYAMAHLAIHDALNAIDRRSRPYALRLRVPDAEPDAAIASAARHTLVPLIRQLPLVGQACIEAGVVIVQEDYAEALGQVPGGSAKREGIALGKAAANAILAVRAGDGANDTLMVDSDYDQGTEPGEYRFTPGSDFAFAPGWADVRPFALADAGQFHPGAPYAVTSKAYARDVAQVQRLGGDDVTTPSARTDEQTEIALFWVESSPQGWNRIARTVATDQGLNPWRAARLFGLLDMALTDGYIGTFETKYQRYNFWRPVTAIRAAGSDGNPDTHVDRTWTPLRVTPPIPDHDSGHTVEGAAAAAVLRGFFGTDRIAFETCSLTLDPGQTCSDASPVTRTYTSFSQASQENGRSRVLVGFHFRHAVVDGLEHGKGIGKYVVDNWLRPVS